MRLRAGRSLYRAGVALAWIAAAIPALAQPAPAPSSEGAGAAVSTQPRPRGAELRIHLNSEESPAREFLVSDHGMSREALAAAAKFSPGEWSRILVAAVADVPATASLPAGIPPGGAARPALPMAGDQGVDGEDLFFRPRFGLRPGMSYVAWFDPGALADALAAHSVAYLPPFRMAVDAPFAIPAANMEPSAVVEGIDPGAETVPSNTLRFYIRFSEPMSRGASYDHLELLRAGPAPQPVADPFLDLTQELWSPDGKRFTLFLHPGRIKQGLVPNLEEGPPMQPGQRYILRVKADWKDAKGRPLKQAFEKAFSTGPRDEASPDPRRWKIVAPASGSQSPLAIEFGESLDHALLQRMIEVRDPAGAPVAGTIETSDSDRRWLFRPARPWPAGKFALSVSPQLEDLAGNSIAKPFEVRVDDPPPLAPPLRIDFAVQ